MSSLSDLPIDVARYILEIAAMHDQQLACQLVYVSKAVREWIDPILYHTVVLTGQDEDERLLFVESCNKRIAKDPGFYARNVKVICIQGFTSYPVVEFIVTHCTGVQVLAAWFYMDDGTPYPANLIGSMNTRRLSLAGDGSRLVACISPNVTHLNLLLDACVEDWIDWEDLFRCCPYLTHVLFDIEDTSVGNWNSELLAEGTLSKFRDVLKAAPPSFKALIFEIVASGDAYATSDDDSEFDDEYLRSSGTLGHAEGFDVAAANLVNAMSDKRFVFIVPNNRFAYVSGLVCYQYTHNPLADWGYRAAGEVDAFETADRHLRTVEQ